MAAPRNRAPWFRVNSSCLLNPIKSLHGMLSQPLRRLRISQSACPSREGVGKGALAGWTLFHGQNSAAPVGINNKNVEPGSLFEQLHVALHLGVRRVETD